MGNQIQLRFAGRPRYLASAAFRPVHAATWVKPTRDQNPRRLTSVTRRFPRWLKLLTHVRRLPEESSSRRRAPAALVHPRLPEEPRSSR